MRKFISVLLVLTMVAPMLIVGASATGASGQCYSLNPNASYGYFTGFSMSASDTVFSFDIAMAPEEDGSLPVFSMNAGEISISTTGVTVAGSTASISWGTVETKHWHHFEISYSGGAANVEFDGSNVLSVASGASCRTSGVVLVGAVGTTLLDNLVISNNAGVVIKSINFDDEAVYLDARHDDSTAVRTSVPAGSYSDYSDVEDYSVIFTSSEKTAMLSTSEFSAAQNSAKLTYSGTNGGAANAFLDLSSQTLSADDYSYVVVTYMTPNSDDDYNSDVADSAAVIGAIGSSTPNESIKQSFDLTTDGHFHSAVIDMSSLSGWSGTINGLQLRFFESANSGDVMYVDSIVLCASLSKASVAASERETAKANFGIFNQPAALGILSGEDYICNFDSAEDMQYVSNGNNTSFVYDSEQNAMKCTVTGASDPSVYVDLTNEGLSADTYKYVVYTYRIPTSSQVTNPTGNFFYVCGSITVPTGGYESSMYSYAKDGALHYSVIDLSAKSNYSGVLKGLRIDYFNDANVGDVVYIDSIIFCKTNAAAVAAGNVKINYIPGNGFGQLVGTNYVCNFDSSMDIQEYVTNSNNTTFAYDPTFNALSCTATSASDPSVYVDLSDENLSADVYKYMVYTYRIAQGIQKTNPFSNFYYVCGSITVPTGGYETVPYSLNTNGDLKYIVVDLSQKSNWSGTVKGMRIDYFTEAIAGDKIYIDSLIFCTSNAAAVAAGEAKTTVPEVLDPNDASAVWNSFWQNGTVSGDEYVARGGDSGNEPNMYFKYNSKSALTQTSLGNRFAKAVKTVTDVDLTVQVYTGFSDIKSAFKELSNGGSTTNNMQFTLIPEDGPAYCIYVPVTIIFDTSCSSDLNGDDTVEADPVTPNLSQTSAAGVTVTDSSSSFNTTNELAYHSNHENRVVHTANKTFAVYPTGSLGEWGSSDSAQFEIFEVGSNGAMTSFYTGSARNATCKPQIFLGYDGMVYVFYGCDTYDSSASAELDAYYFNPSASTYSVTKVSAVKAYSGGQASGGYGYFQPILDNAQKKVHMMFCGGSNGTGDFAWFTFNQETKSWESNARHISIGRRHCYVYGYADGQGGVNLVAQRDIEIEDVGLDESTVGAGYAWDELSLFHIPDMYSSSYTKDTFAPADYSQSARSLYPVVQNNTYGDTYLASDGKLHILYQKTMYKIQHHNKVYSEMWHAVYDTTVSGTPVLLYNMPIRFVNEANAYAAKFAESTSGDLYILAMPSNVNGRVEVWTSADANDYTFTFDSARTFTDTNTSIMGMVVTGPRNGSVQNNVIECMYPTRVGDQKVYRYFKVTLP